MATAVDLEQIAPELPPDCLLVDSMLKNNQNARCNECRTGNLVGFTNAVLLI